MVAAYDAALVDELLTAYEDAKNNFYLGGLRLSAVEGGRFAEAAFRMLQQETSGRCSAQAFGSPPGLDLRLAVSSDCEKPVGALIYGH